MRKQLLLAAVAFFLSMGTLFAQAPEKFNYQGIARDASGQALAGQGIKLRLSVRTSSATGPVLYTEDHSVTTNAYGLYNVAVGDGTPVTGTFGTVDWGSTLSRFLQVQIDPNGGSSFTTVGSTQLLSVPYSLYAANGWKTTGNTYWNPNSGGRVGIGTSAAGERLDVAGRIRSRKQGTAGGAVRFTNSSGATQLGLVGMNNDTTIGLWGPNSSWNFFMNTNTGFIGIGTAAPIADLDILQSTSNFPNPATGGINLRGGSDDWRIWNSNPYLSFAYNGTRVAYINQATGAYLATSDARFKKNITELPSVLERVNQLRVVEYQYKHQSGPKDKDLSLGFLAQEVKPHFPELVRYQEDKESMALNYAEFGVLAIKAIQEQQKIINDLTARLEALENK